VDKEMIDRYKKWLRTIWLKTHPDKVADKGFTPEQHEVLRNFYRQATEMNATERLINPLTLERHRKSATRSRRTIFEHGAQHKPEHHY
jgi:preprotein translocase subunit Sec63